MMMMLLVLMLLLLMMMLMMMMMMVRMYESQCNQWKMIASDALSDEPASRGKL